MGSSRARFTIVISFPTATKLINCATATANTPNTPRNPPAIGPKNWNKVKNWFSAPTSGEKLIFIPTNARTVKSPKNTIPRLEIFFID